MPTATPRPRQYGGMQPAILLTLFLLGSALLALVMPMVIALGSLIMHERLRRRALSKHGWEAVRGPALALTRGLNLPPFGIGFDRHARDAIRGTAGDQTPFIAFAYSCTHWSDDGYVVRMPLPQSYLTGEVDALGRSGRIPLGAASARCGAALATAPDPQVAAAYGNALAPYLSGPWRISVDHQDLVLIGAPRQVKALAATVEALARARAALLALPREQFTGPPPPPGLSVYGHEDWGYAARDDARLAQVIHTTEGDGHQAKDVIWGRRENVSFVRLTHIWQTGTARSGPKGMLHSVSTQHQEQLCEFHLGFPFINLSVNRQPMGSGLKSAGEDVAQRFTVSSPSPLFTSDMVSQRQMEYLMDWNPDGFTITDGRGRFTGEHPWTPQEIEKTLAFLIGFFDRAPDLARKELDT